MEYIINLSFIRFSILLCIMNLMLYPNVYPEEYKRDFSFFLFLGLRTWVLNWKLFVNKTRVYILDYLITCS